MSAGLAATLPGQAREEIDRFAIRALRAEVELYPKAGLVSFIDTGSHQDMDAATFLRSAAALEGYFGEMAAAGAAGADFATLNAIGLSAEQRMFAATKGVNTHRGAVFSLGLLAAAAGIRRADGDRCPYRICRTVERWGQAILANRPPCDASHGALVHIKYGAPGAREEAAAGFPTLIFHALPAFETVYRVRRHVAAAALQAFYATMSVLDDNNLLYRGGADGLDRARSRAQDFLDRGGMLAAEGHERAERMHHAFVAENLSPGGSADLLAATLFLAAESRMIEWE